MKKILSLVLVLIAISQVNAKGIEPESPLGTSVVKHGALVKLFYRGEESGKVTVTIYNENGLTLFRETFQNTDQFMRPYNFSALPSGDYRFEIMDANGKRYEKVTHTVNSKKTRVAHLTRLSDRESKYMLAVPNKGSDQIQIKIYDGKNSIVYQATETITGNFAKVYDLTSIEGSHTFQITDSTGRVSRLSKPIR
jgi:hypothetical protein